MGGEGQRGRGLVSSIHSSTKRFRHHLLVLSEYLSLILLIIIYSYRVTKIVRDSFE